MNYHYLEGTVINPDAPEDSLESKVPYVDNGTERFDPRRYYCKDFMQQEWEHLWTRVWQIAGVESDIPEAGDYMVYRILRENILVVRQDDGTVRAFYNVCPHRGNRLVHNDRGSVAAFTCSFHSWRFGICGKLQSITDEETFRKEVVCHRPDMKEVRCETRAGIVFINLDPEAPPLEERIGLPEGYLENYHLDRMHVVRHVVSEWGANWKTGVDAFYETYHLHAVHPETQTVMGDLNTQYDLYPFGASRMIVPLCEKSSRVEDQDSVDAGLQFMMQDAGMDPEQYTGDARGVRKAVQASKRRRAEDIGLDYSDLVDGQLTDSWATGVFPNVQIGLHPEGAFLMRFRPHPTDPERFFYDTMTLFRPADDPNYKAPDWMGIPEGTDLTGEIRPETEYIPLGEPPNLGLVLDQDSELLPVLQNGIRSRGFDGPLWSEQEQRLRHFHTELDRYISGER
ncbi:MAG: aromatic ring-hydroxylating dioxygenase subunit alpha [Xanthomonadales bacterium]|nr:aromatic ring-hydroxylating dioxygenase subunit alpha [Xanthomonadales bacterium]